ncbi:hypothetical protein KIN20_006854 [Parelaphostrongylus tenuis]|uniref:Uncharacterized protein n=1 Tax=Parelaphostrongylus tenuis TaxID=148309 RepID=A0AAD5M4D5_PARTN|nr:hypothetical protein KIN20_006854 [Parelaphostrongylus tenuis]
MGEQSGEAPTPDDNLLLQHKQIAESIEMIRLKKDQLLRTLRGLSENENPDRDLMAKLVDAFDTMTAQENSFLAVLKNIVQIHEQATNDVAKENDELAKNGNDLGSEQSQVVRNEIQQNKDEGNEEDDDLIRETLKELEQVSMQALAAAELNEKLVETLQRHKKNRALMLEMRKDKAEMLKTAANAAMVEVKKAKKEVSINRAELQKKQREADELRKAALKAGIQVGANEQKQKKILWKRVGNRLGKIYGRKRNEGSM